MEIEIVNPDSQNYDSLEAFVDAPSPRFDYTEFMNHYNGSEIGAIMVFEYRGSMMSNFTKILGKRGLIRGISGDYEYKATQAGSEKGTYKVVLKKLTDTPCNNP